MCFIRKWLEPSPDGKELLRLARLYVRDSDENIRKLAEFTIEALDPVD